MKSVVAIKGERVGMPRVRLEGSSGFGVGAMANSVRLRWRLKMEIKQGGDGPWTKAKTRRIGY